MCLKPHFTAFNKTLARHLTSSNIINIKILDHMNKRKAIDKRDIFLLARDLTESSLNNSPLELAIVQMPQHTNSTSSNYSILVLFFIIKKNFIKNIKKSLTADTLYLDERVENE
jgi:hypothetical protein